MLLGLPFLLLGQELLLKRIERRAGRRDLLLESGELLLKGWGWLLLVEKLLLLLWLLGLLLLWQRRGL